MMQTLPSRMIGSRLLFILRILTVLSWTLGASAASSEEGDSQTCAWGDQNDGCTGQIYDEKANLKTFDFSLPGEENVTRSFDAFVTPDVSTFYNETPGTLPRKEPRFQGMFGKFINMSPKQIRIYWQPSNSKSQASFISDVEPFGCAGTATFPGHIFVVADAKSKKIPTVHENLDVFFIRKGNSLYSYDPFGSVEKASEELKPEQFELYMQQHRSIVFSKLYEKVTGRQYIALFGKKKRPRYFMWPADSIGQTYTISTNETHIVSPPSDQVLSKGTMYGASVAQRDALKPFRSPKSELNLTMTVLSVAPRVFEIKNFLSGEEAHHILEVAAGMKLARSTTNARSDGARRESSNTRTSKNSWINREQSPIIDLVYRRAAHVMKIDEALFRFRRDDEKHHLPNVTSPICERLQLVHYDEGQQYTPHHDFAMPDLAEEQPARFATMLLYLNEGMVGGETSFPRWLNAESREALKVAPEVGKAVLFYNQLPDGNYDDLSQHAALPVINGEKWLTNLWVWDPYMYNT